MQTGDRCPNCRKGQMKVRTSKPSGGGAYQTQYFECSHGCGHEGKATIPAENVMRRKVVAYN